MSDTLESMPGKRKFVPNEIIKNFRYFIFSILFDSPGQKNLKVNKI